MKANQYTGSSSWNEAYQAVYWPAAEPGSIVGINIQDFSRIVSEDLVYSEAGLKTIKNYLLNLPGSIPFIWQNYVGGVAKDVPTDATAVHPAWRKAFAFIDVVNFGTWNGSTATQNSTSTALVANMTEVFGTAAYYNEAWDEVKWQDSFFGTNYARLLKIKKAVDPKSVFNCRLCVGSEGGF
jgi:FAD/FMN-containing dehydrogenase